MRTSIFSLIILTALFVFSGNVLANNLPNCSSVAASDLIPQPDPDSDLQNCVCHATSEDCSVNECQALFGNTEELCLQNASLPKSLINFDTASTHVAWLSDLLEKTEFER